MSETVAFDTHRFVKRLTQGGFTEKQAETLAEEQVALLNSNLATKAELAKVEANLLAKLAKVEANLLAKLAKVEASLKAEIKAETASAKADLLKWMIGATIAQGGLVVALVKLL